MTSNDETGNPTTTTMRWDPARYEQFAKERARPFHDLLSRVDIDGPRDVADIGCGPGSLTAELWERWPTARVLGVDNSPEMLADAAGRAVAGRIEFELADIHRWQPDRQFDVICSNATLQWVPGHLQLLGRLAGFLRPGGILALQVPGNFDEPTHRLLAELVAAPRWASELGDSIGEPPSSHDPGEYLAELTQLGLDCLAWETTYFQVLEGQDAVLDWMKGTALRPVLSALPAGSCEAFLSEYGELLRTAYPTAGSRTVLPFRRVFAVGRSAGGEAAGTVTALDHTQVAMPAGGEGAARAFYCGLLGFVEVAKPPTLAGRGGCWFKAAGAEVHMGVEKDFRPARKAHVGLVVDDLDAVAARLRTAEWCRVAFDEELAPRRRFFTDDPFGNRVEILEPAR
ncbi:MAG: methyltransferase domain-containing protein [Acidimicrobiales bacterium]